MLGGRHLIDHLLQDEGAPGEHDERMKRSIRAHIAFFFQHASPRLIGVFFVGSAVARALYPEIGVWDAVIALGVVIYWPIQEWALHRFVMHMVPRKILGIWVDPIFARAHRLHHNQPWTPGTTFLPPYSVLAMIFLTVFAWLAAIPVVPLALTGMTVNALAALLYEWTHYLTHSAYVPRTNYWRGVVRNHRLHHFKNENYWFAFTGPFVDTMFKTNPDQANVPKSETARTLGVQMMGRRIRGSLNK